MNRRAAKIYLPAGDRAAWPSCQFRVKPRSVRVRRIAGEAPDPYCRHNALYRIDGYNLCARHAAKVALSILLKAKGRV